MKEFTLISIVTCFVTGVLIAFLLPICKKCLRNWRIKAIYAMPADNRKINIQKFLKKYYDFSDFKSGFLPSGLNDLGDEVLSYFLVSYLHEERDAFISAAVYWIVKNRESDTTILLSFVNKLCSKTARILREKLYYASKSS